MAALNIPSKPLKSIAIHKPNQSFEDRVLEVWSEEGLYIILPRMRIRGISPEKCEI